MQASTQRMGGLTVSKGRPSKPLRYISCHCRVSTIALHIFVGGWLVALPWIWIIILKNTQKEVLCILSLSGVPYCLAQLVGSSVLSLSWHQIYNISFLSIAKYLQSKSSKTGNIKHKNISWWFWMSPIFLLVEIWLMSSCISARFCCQSAIYISMAVYQRYYGCLPAQAVYQRYLKLLNHNWNS